MTANSPLCESFIEKVNSFSLPAGQAGVFAAKKYGRKMDKFHAKTQSKTKTPVETLRLCSLASLPAGRLVCGK
jgi:hypothetical protein